MKFACDICGNPLGYIDTTKIQEPMTAEMFTSLMPERGVPAPFQNGCKWEQLFCRICKHRAFHNRDRVTLIDESGKKEMVHIDTLKPKFVCECGKEYQHQASLSRHRKDCDAART
jgi:hypothetical protein